MEYVARKVKRARWSALDDAPGGDRQAEALRCLKTMDNGLSLWMCGRSRDDVAEVALVMASLSTSLEKISIVLIEKRALETAGLDFHESQGRTIVDDLKDRHLDVTGISIAGLCGLGRMICEAIDAGQVEDFTSVDLKEILYDAIQARRLNLDALKPGVIKRLRKEYQI